MEEPAVIEEPVAATEEVIATVAEVLEQLPEGTDLVVVDSSGEALPLVSQEAADTLDSPSADPFFWDGTKYVGYSATGVCPAVVTTCNTSTTPLQAAITAFGATNTATGSIYVESGTYAAGVTIDGSAAGNIKNLTGLVGAGSSTTILNGGVTVYNMNAFTFQGFTLNGMFNAQNNNGTLNITDVVQSNGGKTGINVESNTGNVNLTDVKASGNGGYGVYIGNIKGNVTVAGKSDFGNNRNGLTLYNITGAVTINDAVIHDNGTAGIYDVAYPAPANLTLNCVTFTNNPTNISGGAATVNASPCGSSGQAYVPFAVTAPVIPPVTPPVTALVPVAPSGVVVVEKETETAKYTSLYTTLGQTQEQLPAALEAGTFGSALKVALTDQGANAADIVIKLSFPIPASMKDANLVVMFWDGSAWVEVSGGSVVDGSFVIIVAQPGTYVLIAK